MKTVTFVIPTKDRPEFLSRLFRYYRSQDAMSNYDFFVGDASDERIIAKNRDICRGSGARHFILRGKIGETIKFLSGSIRTPYAVVLPDDDLLFPAGVNRAVDFLDKNKRFHSANGRCAQIVLAGPSGKIWDLGEYPLSGLEGKTAKDRLWAIRSVLLFSVYRAEVFRRMWLYSDEGPHDQSIHDEIMPICIGAMLGETKHLEELYLLRQEHPVRYIGAQWLDWVRSPEFLSARKIFIRAVSESVPDGTLSQEAIAEYFDLKYTCASPKPVLKSFSDSVLLKRIKIFYLNHFVRRMTLSGLTETSPEFRAFREQVEGGI